MGSSLYAEIYSVLTFVIHTKTYIPQLVGRVAVTQVRINLVVNSGGSNYCATQ